MTDPRNAHTVAWLRHRQKLALQARDREAAEIAAQILLLPSVLQATLAAAEQKAAGAKLLVEAARSKQGRKAAQRMLTKAEAEQKDAAAALEMERRHEALAPRVQRTAIATATVVLREARVRINANGRVTTQHALDRLFARGAIPKHCLRAGRRYRDAHEQAHRDLYPTALGQGGGGSGASSGNIRIEEATACSIELSAARATLGTFNTAVVEHVAIHDLTLQAWTERRGNSEQEFKGFLRGALERLAEFWIERDAAMAKPTVEIRGAEFR